MPESHPISNSPILPRRRIDELRRIAASTSSLDPQALEDAQKICNDVRQNGQQAVARFAVKFGEMSESDAARPDAWSIDREAMAAATGRVDPTTLDVLKRTAARITDFARLQLESLQSLRTKIPGGFAGHEIVPIERAGCYAPAGRYPLPSSVLMTAAVARAAGCQFVCLATPRPGDLMLAAAHVANADCVVPIGGAHAIAALAYGTEHIDPVDIIVGPGNAWVTAAKHIVSANVGIDMLAGPSELTVLADDTASPTVIAADLLAQAEHDPSARTYLVTTSEAVAGEVESELARQLATLSTAAMAKAALQGGGTCVAESMPTAIELVNELAPEHLQLMCTDAKSIAAQINHAGATFVGRFTAEVFGDYGVGPNHTLPTGNTARYRGGLSVLDFCRVRTFIDLDGPLPGDVRDDILALAKLEGLAAHEAAARIDR